MRNRGLLLGSLTATLLLAAPLLVPPAGLSAQEGTPSFAIPAVQGTVRSIRFFEAAPPVPPRAERSYATRFEAGPARYIYTELDIRHEPTGREGVEFIVTCTYHRPDGTVIGAAPLTFRPPADWAGVVHTNALGSERSGAWQTGMHRVDCAHEGRSIAEASFEIVDAPPVVASVNGHFRSIRTFEWGDTQPPQAERTHAWRFEAATARRIGIELGLRFPAPGRLVAIPALCRTTHDDGSTFHEGDLNLQVQPDWTGVVSTVTMGNAEPGGWQPGTYRVSCHHGDRLLGSTRFELY